MQAPPEMCDICGGNLINGSCPEHDNRSPVAAASAGTEGTAHGVVPIHRLGATGRILTEREIGLINNPFKIGK